jgi:hypothetical protein
MMARRFAIFRRDLHLGPSIRESFLHHLASSGSNRPESNRFGIASP